jgi:hypothetical protein
MRFPNCSRERATMTFHPMTTDSKRIGAVIPSLEVVGAPRPT